MNMRWARVAGAVALGALFYSPAFAQDAEDFPSKPVHMVVPFSAGGATDVLARIVAEGLSRTWGQPVVVENRPGATGAIAADYVKEAPADGYTLLVGTASVNSVAPSFRDDLSYDTLRDFEPVTSVAVFPNMLVVHPSVEADNAADLISLLKANPEEFSFASSGIGSSIHLTGELFKQATGTDMVHIPYAGSAPARTDLVAGNVKVMFDNMSSVLPLVEDGRLVALGVTSLERDPTHPEIPAIAETIPGFDATSWIGLLAPNGTPEAILNKIAEAVADVVEDQDVATRMENLGLTAATNAPDEFTKFLENDLAKWKKVVDEAGLKPGR